MNKKVEVSFFKNLLVVSIEQAVAAPICSMRFADAGARVIKVEPINGETARHYDKSIEGESAYFSSLNRGKESLTLNLRKDHDFSLLKKILSKADVFIRNTSPGSMANIGLGASKLLNEFKRLIVVDLVGYGQDTEYSDIKAYDLLVQAESGLCSITGSPNEPSKVGISIADMGTGMNAYSAILEALLERESNGIGKALEITMFDTVAEWMSVPLLHYEHANIETKRHGMAHSSIYPYRPYSCSDGDVVIAVQNNDQWKKFCDVVLSKPILADNELYKDNASRVENRILLDKEIDKVFKDLTTKTLKELLKKSGIAFGQINTVKELSTHLALKKQVIEINKKKITTPASPLVREIGGVKRIPKLGEHNSKINEEFSRENPSG